MKCQACGREINNTSKYCKHCGAPITPDKNENELLTNKCCSCGAIVKPGTLFCTQCGAPLSKRKKKKRSSKHFGLGFVILSCFIVLGMLGAYLYLSGDKDPDNQKEDKADIIQTENSDQEKEKDSSEKEDTEDTNEDGSSSTASQDDELESIILNITDEKNEIDSKIHSGTYDTLIDKNGIIFYRENSLPAAIFVPEDYKNDGYQKKYYFTNSKLIFAEHMGHDHHQFFYKDDQLLRWRYNADTTNATAISDYDKENTEPYLQWQQRILDETNEMIGIMNESGKNSDAGESNVPDVSIEVSSGKMPFYGIWIAASKDENEAKTFTEEAINNGFEAQLFITTDWINLNSEKWYVVSAGVYMDSKSAENALENVQKIYPDAYVKYSGSNTNEFVFADSDKRYISSSDLSQLSQEEVRTAINELYARHGRKFFDKAIQKYFDSKSWYSPKIEPDDFTEDVFNDYERKNKETLVEWEESHGWREKSPSGSSQ